MSLRILWLWCKQTFLKRGQVKTDRLKARILIFLLGTLPIWYRLLTTQNLVLWLLCLFGIYLSFVLVFFKLEFKGKRR